MTIIDSAPSGYMPDAIGGMNRLYGCYVGLVKGNADAQMMGRLQVCIPDLGGDPADSTTWHIVNYVSPFAGATDIESTKAGSDMASTQLAYGWWAIPPDINNQVLVMFGNGDPGQGFYIGCIYQQFMNHMVPGIAAGQATDGQGGVSPPVCEYNKRDPSQAQNYWNPSRPTFKPLNDGLTQQGLTKDPERGPASTSARREAPSQVFGFSTPRGNCIHVDDNPKNEFIRLRTRSGAQILIHETTGYIYMISRGGNSWMSIADVGIDMYSARSISMRAEENINMHADSCVITHGVGAVHTTGGNLTRSSKGRITDIACGEQIRHSPRIKDNSKQNGNNGQQKGSPGTGAMGATGPTGPVTNNGKALTKAEMDQLVANGGHVGNGQCVTLDKVYGTDVNGNPLGPASGYYGVQAVTRDNVTSLQGQAVATTNDNGAYAANGGAEGGGNGYYTHAGIVYGPDPNNSNNFLIVNQWNKANGEVQISSIPYSGGKYNGMSTIGQR